MRRNWYRPKTKANLVRHLSEQDHSLDIVVPINEKRWTMAALVELHDGIHSKRMVQS